VLNLRSRISIVIPAARTGSDRSRRKEVIIIAQQKREYEFLETIPILNIVTRKLIDLKILDTLAIWREKITKSTLESLWAKPEDRGG